MLILPHHAYSCVGLDPQEMPAHLKPVQPAVPESCASLCARVHAVRTIHLLSPFSLRVGSSPAPPRWDARPGWAPTPARLAHCPSQSGAIASPSNVPASPAASARPRPLCDAGLRTPPNDAHVNLYFWHHFSPRLCVCVIFMFIYCMFL